MTVYMNLHPSYDYTTAILGSDGYVEVREYVTLVDWLVWAGIGHTAKREIHICGNWGDREKARVEHMERAYVFGQRLEEAGCTVLVRNARGDEWQPFQSKGFTREEMTTIECQLRREPDVVRWANKDIQKYGDLLEHAKASGNIEAAEWIEDTLQQAHDNLSEWRQYEQNRCEAIRNLTIVVRE